MLYLCLLFIKKKFGIICFQIDKTINLLNVIEGITIMIISLNIIMKWNEVNEVFSHEKEKLPAIAIVILCFIVVFYVVLHV